MTGATPQPCALCGRSSSSGTTTPAGAYICVSCDAMRAQRDATPTGAPTLYDIQALALESPIIRAALDLYEEGMDYDAAMRVAVAALYEVVVTLTSREAERARTQITTHLPWPGARLSRDTEARR